MADHTHRAAAMRLHLSRIGAPGEEQERKHAYIDHCAHVLQRDTGAVPGWVEELRAEVERGKL